jgi:hypothetical protein
MAAYTIDVEEERRSSSTSRNWTYQIMPREEAPGSIRLEAHRHPPQWLIEIQPRLRELLNLPSNWDGQGAQPVSHHDLAAALAFLRLAMRDDMIAPWIGPLNNGGVQLAWTSDALEVEAVFDHVRNDWELLVTDGENDQEVSIWGGEAMWLFRTVADRLTRSDSVLA